MTRQLCKIPSAVHHCKNSLRQAWCVRNDARTTIDGQSQKLSATSRRSLSFPNAPPHSVARTHEARRLTWQHTTRSARPVLCCPGRIARPLVIPASGYHTKRKRTEADAALLPAPSFARSKATSSKGERDTGRRAARRKAESVGNARVASPDRDVTPFLRGTTSTF